MPGRWNSGVTSALVAGTICLAVPVDSGGPPAQAQPVAPAMRGEAVASADVFAFPLPNWTPHCLGFGSQWRHCNGTVLRTCSGSSAIWLHTGADEVAAVGQPVMAAGDGVIVGYVIDPTFRGGVLIRHRTSFGVLVTQYWHVWLAAGFARGVAVKRGQVFATIADMGSRTHFHFAVFMGDYEPHAWNGALPPARCDGFPAFPYKFVDPTAFIEAHGSPVHVPFEVQF
jgi:murein DD-endopeptidase MepM/ murein hydrolase activator NlpD